MAFPLRWNAPAPLAALACAAALAACTASSPQPQPPGATVNVAPNDSGGPGATSAPAETAAATAAPKGSSDTPPQSVITNEAPPGGTVTANASPAAGSDRLQAMMDLVKANKDGFRKCFDLWGKKNPGQAGKIAFQFFLKPDGTLDKAQMKADEGDVHAAEVENCMIAFAKTLTYPKSSVGKDTIYTHRFEFKAASK